MAKLKILKEKGKIKGNKQQNGKCRIFRFSGCQKSSSDSAVLVWKPPGEQLLSFWTSSVLFFFHIWPANERGKRLMVFSVRTRHRYGRPSWPTKGRKFPNKKIGFSNRKGLFRSVEFDNSDAFGKKRSGKRKWMKFLWSRYRVVILELNWKLSLCHLRSLDSLSNP